MLFDSDGKLIDASPEPMAYLHGGYGGIFPRVENELQGKEVGQEVRLTLDPEDAFGDYDAGLMWFRAALLERSPDESIIESVQSAIFAFPYDVEAVTQIAALRAQELDPGRIVRHTRQVEAEFADAIVEQLSRGTEGAAPDERLHIIVTARCIAAAVFGAMEMWMVGTDRSLNELARLCSAALQSLREGIDTD